MLNIRRETLGTIVILHSTVSRLPHWTINSLRAKYSASSTVQQLPQGHNPLWNWDASSFWAEKTQHQFSSVQSLSGVQLFATPWTAACQPSLSITNSQSLPKLTSVELVMPSNHLILCHPPLLPPSIFPSLKVFPNESVLRTMRPKYWSFSFNISSSSEHSGLTSFRMDWLDLLVVQGTLKSLLQNPSHKWLKDSVLQVNPKPWESQGKIHKFSSWRGFLRPS